MKFFIPFLIGLFFVTPSFAAVSPDEMLRDPALEERARALGKQLRCLVCQNQSIDDSDADLAKDLRSIVRERLLAGDTDAEIEAYMVERYGDFILLKPPVKFSTYLLWAGPLVIFAAGVGIMFSVMKQQRQRLGARGLSKDEQKKLDQIMADGKPS